MISIAFIPVNWYDISSYSYNQDRSGKHLFVLVIAYNINWKKSIKRALLCVLNG